MSDQRPGYRPHQTTPVWVLANIDEGIASFVRLLNTIDGVRTHDCCQGSMGEGGAHPYPAYVSVSWDNEGAHDRLLDLGLIEDGEAHGTVYPSVATLAAADLMKETAGGR